MPVEIDVTENVLFQEGKARAEAKVLVRFLKGRFGPLPDALHACISIANIQALDHWVDRLPTAATLGMSSKVPDAIETAFGRIPHSAKTRSVHLTTSREWLASRLPNSRLPESEAPSLDCQGSLEQDASITWLLVSGLTGPHASDSPYPPIKG